MLARQQHTRTHKCTRMHTHARLNSWLLSLSLPRLLLLLYLVLSSIDVGTAALYPSLSPSSFLLHLGCDFLSKEAAFCFFMSRWFTFGRMAVHLLLLHSLQTHADVTPSLFHSRVALFLVHSSSYLPPNSPSLILFIDIDVSALCLHFAASLHSPPPLLPSSFSSFPVNAGAAWLPLSIPSSI